MWKEEGQLGSCYHVAVIELNRMIAVEVKRREHMRIYLKVKLGVLDDGLKCGS